MTKKPPVTQAKPYRVQIDRFFIAAPSEHGRLGRTMGGAAE
jgi:hypothetical protein